ncbi:hypothetical protein [Commensalibacter sp. Nvir]
MRSYQNMERLAFARIFLYTPRIWSKKFAKPRENVTLYGSAPSLVL